MVDTKFYWSKAQHPQLRKDTYFVDDDSKGVVRGMLARLKGRGDKRILGLDSETTGLDPQMRPTRTRTIQLCHEDVVVVFDLWKMGKESVEQLLNFIADPVYVKVIHNGKFDLKFLMWEFFMSIGLQPPDFSPLFDTQLAAQLLDLGDRYGKHTLGYCLDHYLGVKIQKDIGHGWTDKNLTRQQVMYAANDAAMLPELRAEMIRLGKEKGLLRAYKVEFDAVVPTAMMELNGFKPDRKKWMEVTAESKKKRDESAGRLLKLLPPVKGDTLPMFEGVAHFNLGSNDDLKERLKAVGVNLPTITDDEGVERDTLLSDKMAQVGGTHPAIPLVIEYSQHAKAVNSYGKKFLRFVNPWDHRFHADFRQIGTITTRYSVKEPPLHGIPKKSEHRACFVAEPGWRLVWADYSQIELRILAELSGDEKLIQVFVDGKDLHQFTASEIFGIDPESVDEIQRRRAKDANFGEVYGVGDKRFAERTGLTLEEARRIRAGLAAAYPGKQKYLQNAAAHARVYGFCETMSGKVISFNMERLKQLDPKDYRKAISAIERHGKNYPIQGSSADITKTALRMVHDSMNHSVAKLVNCVHDEIVLEVREDHCEEQGENLRLAMISAGEVFLKRVPVVVDVEVNDYWKKRKAA